MSFLNLENKNILVIGVANKKVLLFILGKPSSKKALTFYIASERKNEKNR